MEGFVRVWCVAMAVSLVILHGVVINTQARAGRQPRAFFESKSTTLIVEDGDETNDGRTPMTGLGRCRRSLFAPHACWLQTLRVFKKPIGRKKLGRTATLTVYHHWRNQEEHIFDLTTTVSWRPLDKLTSPNFQAQIHKYRKNGWKKMKLFYEGLWKYESSFQVEAEPTGSPFKVEIFSGSRITPEVVFPIKIKRHPEFPRWEVFDV